jgi:hypothetical protein
MNHDVLLSVDDTPETESTLWMFKVLQQHRNTPIFHIWMFKVLQQHRLLSFIWMSKVLQQHRRQYQVLQQHRRQRFGCQPGDLFGCSRYFNNIGGNDSDSQLAADLNTNGDSGTEIWMQINVRVGLEVGI